MSVFLIFHKEYSNYHFLLHGTKSVGICKDNITEYVVKISGNYLKAFRSYDFFKKRLSSRTFMMSRTVVY